ncbi:hypothetical protein [Fusobacterium mortiferum]|uniref:Uncharacterized protein n=1 Tax=Fusobacterium mortiferum TaxID=850 RepID=A0ABS2G1Q0_FUSMR|nr:hypothetical protein [Fusobacterium mortiferum]MBM6874690.1 hypothetical protein [Fusobacterium mortiferum]
MKKIIILDGFEESYFETEWLSLFRQTKERTDIDPEVKKQVGSMYAGLLKQIWEQNLKGYKNCKKFDENFTPEFVQKLIKILEKNLKEVDDFLKE